MERPLIALAAACAAVACALACGRLRGVPSGAAGDDGGAIDGAADGPSEDASGTPPWAAFLELAAAEVCAAREPCCASHGFGTPANCAQELAAEATDYYEPLIEKGTVTFDPTGTYDCLEELASSLSTCGADASFRWRARICKDVFVPHLAPGEPCAKSAECRVAAGDDVAECNLDVCASGKSVAQAGEPCGWTCHLLEGGYLPCNGDHHVTLSSGRCMYDAGLACQAGTCAPLAPLGADCQPEFCDAAGRCELGSCIPKKAPGETCKFMTECADTDFCSAISAACEPKPTIGDACSEDVACECSSGTCQQPGFDYWAHVCN